MVAYQKFNIELSYDSATLLLSTSFSLVDLHLYSFAVIAMHITVFLNWANHWNWLVLRPAIYSLIKHHSKSIIPYKKNNLLKNNGKASRDKAKQVHKPVKLEYSCWSDFYRNINSVLEYCLIGREKPNGIKFKIFLKTKSVLIMNMRSEFPVV